MRKKLRNKLLVQSLKFKVQSLVTFSFELSSLSLILLILIGTACSSKDSSHEHSDTYICPMHPTVVSDKPGVCPVCAMDLVRKGRPGEEVKITEDLARLIKSPNEVVVASIQTIKPEYKSMPVILTIQGVVTYDTRAIYTLSARAGGRLEKVFLKYNYQPVRKGQKVAEIYSTELVNAQRDYLYLINHDPDNQQLLEASKSKLLLLGASEKQIEQLSNSQEVTYTFSINSPYDGFVISDDLPAPSAPSIGVKSSGGMGMGGSGNKLSSSSATNTSVSASTFVREGSYVASGQTLFKIVNTHSRWIEFNVPLAQASQIKVGDQVELLNQRAKAPIKIDFAEPFFSEGEDFIKLRSYYIGTSLSIGQLVEAKAQATSSQSLWIPQQALLDLGVDEIVFVKERGLIKARKVSSGLHTGSWVQILSGLASADEVAVNAQYLVDSENFIKTSN